MKLKDVKVRPACLGGFLAPECEPVSGYLDSWLGKTPGSELRGFFVFGGCRGTATLLVLGPGQRRVAPVKSTPSCSNGHGGALVTDGSSSSLLRLVFYALVLKRGWRCWHGHAGGGGGFGCKTRGVNGSVLLFEQAARWDIPFWWSWDRLTRSKAYWEICCGVC